MVNDCGMKRFYQIIVLSSIFICVITSCAKDTVTNPRIVAHGSVFDARTNLPIAGAKVSIAHYASNCFLCIGGASYDRTQITAAVSSADGSYSLNIPSDSEYEYKIEYDVAGYKMMQAGIAAGHEMNKDVYLEPK
jgi:hypothetical protein